MGATLSSSNGRERNQISRWRPHRSSRERRFINWLERKGKELGMRLERGVSAGVKETAKKLVEMDGPEALRDGGESPFPYRA